MNTILRVALAAVIIAVLTLTSTTSAHADAWVSGQIQGLQHVRQSTNVPIARFELTADGQPFTLKQIAFDIEAYGAWVHLQVERVKILDEQGRQIAGPVPVWSDPFVCDCSDGRVIFTEIDSFNVVPGEPRVLTIFADIDGAPLFTSIRVTYKHGDADVIDDRGVSSTAQVIPRVGTSDTSMSVGDTLPFVPADYTAITRFSFIADPSSSQRVLLNLAGYVQPHVAYSVLISKNLVDWQEIGMISPTPYEFLKEAAVGVVTEEFFKTAYFRLRKIDR